LRCRALASPSLVSKRWRSVVFSEPRIWRALSIQPSGQASWFAGKLWLLQRVGGLVRSVTLHAPQAAPIPQVPLNPASLLAAFWAGPEQAAAAVEAAAALLQHLPGVTDLVVPLSNTNLPAIQMHAVGTLGSLTSLQLCCQEPEEPSSLGHALSRLTGLQSLVVFCLPPQAAVALARLRSLTSLRSGWTCGSMQCRSSWQQHYASCPSWPASSAQQAAHYWGWRSPLCS